MDELVELPPAEPAPPAPVRSRPLLAWLVILAMAAFVMRPPLPAVPDEREQRARINLGLIELQARYFVGAAGLFPAQAESFYEQARILDRGPAEQRLRFAILAGELAGPEKAEELLASLAGRVDRSGVPADETSRRLTFLLERLYEGRDERRAGDEVLSAAERDDLRRELGWFGELALASGGGDSPARAGVLTRARATVALVLGVVGTFLLLVAVGAVLLVTGVVLVNGGVLRPRLETGSPYGGIYAETFALWMATFVALSVLVHVLGPPLDRRLLASGLVGLGSLLALAYPLARGVPWRELRRDLGLCAGVNPLREAGAGLVCYVAALPLLVLGVGATLALLRLQQRWTVPAGDDVSLAPNAHPLVGFLVRADAWGIAQALFLAALAAPVVEETMFRGALYRHLREASRHLGRVGSFLIAGLLVSLVFAAVHPQGWTSIPVLMSLAAGFTLAREWRGSLVGPVVAHGLNNATVTLLVVMATR